MFFLTSILPQVLPDLGVASHGGGEAIGIVNSARIGGAFLGPVLATTLLTWVWPAMLYLVLAVVGLGCVPFAAGRHSSRGGR